MLLLAVLFVLAPARAYETDPYTQRDLPLADATPIANAHADEILARAIERTDRRIGCRADDATTRRILAKAIERQTDPPHLVLHRGPIGAFGFSSFSGWMETDPRVPMVATRRRDTIFAEVRLLENYVLWLVGPSDGVRMGEIWVGTDKFDHFWDVGWVLYHVSRDGTDLESALFRSLRLETGYLGYRTSGAVSYGDLRANYDGYRFYAGLLGESSIVRRGPDGCLVQTRPWDWTEWVDRDWDEFLNPAHFTPRARRAIDRALEGQDARICALDAAARDAAPSRVPVGEYVVVDRLEAAEGRVRPELRERTDAWRRAERCGSPAPQAGPPPADGDAAIQGGATDLHVSGTGHPRQVERYILGKYR